MLKLTAYEGESLGVFGLGMSGLATIRALIAGGAEVYAWDDNPDNRIKCKEQEAGAHYLPPEEWPWDSLTKMILSPGVPLTHPAPHAVVGMAKASGCAIIGDIELLAEATPNVKKIGITGTNGKSTTTALTGHLLEVGGVKAAVGGNIGVPALALDTADTEWLVLEMSSYQLDLLDQTRFDIAALMNITPDHLSRHGGLEGYINVKQRIFKGAGVQLVSVDDAPTRAMADRLKALDPHANVIPFSVERRLEAGTWVENGIVHLQCDERTLDLNRAPALKGAHNWQNAAVAIMIAFNCGVTFKDIQRGLESFGGLPHRMQHVAQAGPVHFVNDSKGTNADASIHALKAYSDLHWIAGGVAKEGGIDALVPCFGHVRKAYLIGEAAVDFSETLEEHDVEFEICRTLDKAVVAAARDALTKGGGTVLLSPACASFDQFQNFEQRGEAFTLLARKIEEEHHGEQHEAAAG